MLPSSQFLLTRIALEKCSCEWNIIKVYSPQVLLNEKCSLHGKKNQYRLHIKNGKERQKMLNQINKYDEKPANLCINNRNVTGNAAGVT